MIVLFIATVLVSAIWQPALIAAIAWGALRISRCTNATTRHAVWTIALLASVIVPFVSAATLLMPKAPTAPVIVHSAITAPRQVARPASAPIEKPVTQNAAALPSLPVERPHLHVRPTIAQIAAGVWGLIALVILGRLIFSFTYLERLKHDALPLSVERRHELSRWERAEKGPRDVRICVSPEIAVPVAVGIFDAMILLPQDLVDELEPMDLDRILLHELAHVRRSDDWINLFERLSLALFFFSPGIYWIARQMDLEREVACDDWVLAQAAENVPYARCLTRIVEMTQWPHRAVAAPGVFVTRKSMSIRIERLLARGRDVRIRLAVVPSLISVVAIAAIVIAGGFVSPTIAYTMDSTAIAMKPSATAKPVPPAKPVRMEAVTKVPAAAHTLKPAPTMPPNADVVVHHPTPNLHPQVAYQKTTNVETHTTVSTNTNASASANTNVNTNTIFPKDKQVVADAGYLDDLAAAGFKGLSADEVIEMKSVGVTGDYIRQMHDAGLTQVSARELVELKSVGVTPDYIKAMRNAGLAASSARTWTELKSVGVTPEYAAQLRNAGVSGLDTHMLSELKAVGVDPDYIKQLANAGYPHLSAREYEEMRAVGVTPDYIRGLSKHGFNGLSVHKLIEFKAEGIDPQ